MFTALLSGNVRRNWD